MTYTETQDVRRLARLVSALARKMAYAEDVDLSDVDIRELLEVSNQADEIADGFGQVEGRLEV